MAAGTGPASKAELICPKCGGSVSYDSPYWIWQGKFYCSERCVRLAGGMKV